MKKIFQLITSCALVSSSLIFSESNLSTEKLNVTTKDLISNHVEFAKTSVDKKCNKLKKKIKKSEEQLRDLEINAGQSDSKINDRRSKLLEKIKKYENQIYSLKLLKSSTETIDFTDL